MYEDKLQPDGRLINRRSFSAEKLFAKEYRSPVVIS